MTHDEAFWWLVVVVLTTMWCMSIMTIFTAPRPPVRVQCEIKNPAPVWYGTYE